jgi:hypothetical protein
MPAPSTDSLRRGRANGGAILASTFITVLLKRRRIHGGRIVQQVNECNGDISTINYDFRVANHPENCSAILTAFTVRVTLQQSLSTLGNLTTTNLQRTTILNTTAIHFPT